MILAEIITRLKGQMVINLLITFFGLITTVLTVRLYGLSVFGELVVINAVIGILTIINLIIPPNYSVYKLQDDPKFINVLLLSLIHI